MSVKKAVIIVLILFIITAGVFVFLYFKKIAGAPGGQVNDNKAQSEERADLTGAAATSAKLQDQINSVFNRENIASSTASVRRDVVDTINQGIINYEKSLTPEQISAQQKADAERQKIVDQINAQILQQLRK